MVKILISSSESGLLVFNFVLLRYYGSLGDPFSDYVSAMLADEFD